MVSDVHVRPKLICTSETKISGFALQLEPKYVVIVIEDSSVLCILNYNLFICGITCLKQINVKFWFRMYMKT